MAIGATNIGRVEFIVGFNGRGLPGEARRLAAQAQTAGADFGESFADGANDSFTKEWEAGLSASAKSTAKRLSKEGTLAGHTYGEGLVKGAQADFRKMQKLTESALFSQEGFDRFVKGAGSVDAAIDQLRENVKRLAAEPVKVGDGKSPFFDAQSGGYIRALSALKQFGDVAREVEQRTEILNDRARDGRLAWTRFSTATDFDSFRRVAEALGGATEASERFHSILEDLLQAGAVSEEQYYRTAAALDKHRERLQDINTNEDLDRQTKATQLVIRHSLALDDLSDELRDVAKAQRDTAVVTRKALDAEAKAHDISIAQWEKDFLKIQKSAQARIDLNEVMKDQERLIIEIDDRMGDSKAWNRHVKSMGSVEKAYADVAKLIVELGDNSESSDRQVARLRRQLDGLAESSHASAAALRKAAGETDTLFDKLKSFLGARGGLSLGSMIGLIAGLFEPVAVGVQGASAAIVAAVASIGAALAGFAAIGGAAIAGLTFTMVHAVSAAQLMKKEFPAAAAGMKALGTAAKNDSRAFARAWGPALADFSNTLAKLWTEDKMGERAGDAMAEITKAFTGVLKSPAYKNFAHAMETSIPDALGNLGSGLASGFGGLLNIIAAAAPALERFSETFEDIIGEWADGIQDMAESGELEDKINELVDSMDNLFETIGQVTGALGTFFKSGRASGDRLIDTLGNAFVAWDNWMGSVEGHDALERFWDSGERIFQAVIDILPDIQEGFDKMVSEDAIRRTEDLIAALGDLFSGPLADLTNIIGALDVFGLMARALNDLSVALAPLQEPMEDLAEAISGMVDAGIDILAGAFAGLAAALAPIVEVVAKLIDANPEAAAAGILAIVTALVALRSLKGMAALAVSLGEGSIAFTELGLAGMQAQGRLTKVTKFFGKMGLWGAAAATAAVGISALAEGINEWVLESSGVNDATSKAAGGFKSLRDTVREVSNDTSISRSKLEEWVNLAGEAGSTGMVPLNTGIQALRDTLTLLDDELVGMPLEDAAARFATWAGEVGASREEAAVLLQDLPQLRQAIEDHLKASGLAATETDVLAFAMENFNAKTVPAVTSTQDLADAISGMNDQMFVSRDASRNLQDQIAALDEVVATTGLDLNEAGTGFDQFSEAGRRQEEQFDRTAQAIFDHAAQVLEDTNSAAAAKKVIDEQTAALEDQLVELGFTEAAAKDYIDQLLETPEAQKTVMELDTAAAEEELRTFLQKQRIIDIQVRATMPDLNGAASGTGRPGFASGTIATRATLGVFGEAGPEALVPLRRPLSQVDPSVRALSAFAQGIRPRMAGGGVAVPSPARILNVHEGAVQIVGPDARLAAIETVNRLVEVTV